ncbi:MAG: oxygen-dependent coproporphyrinogen oxidase [Acidimicrobiia bacterium]
MKRSDIEAAYREIQEQFSSGLEALDADSQLRVDDWDRDGGGGGVTRIITGPGHIEKAAINFSAVFGPTPTVLSESLAAGSTEFYATGVSIIVHPRNPNAPTFHANIRYFETDNGDRWFGGGADLTPYYLFEEDATHFHETLKTVCDAHPVADYRTWKSACDRYFYLPHRGEARGVGGLFFDHLTDDLGAIWNFLSEFSDSLSRAYLPILEQRIGIGYGEDETRWHEIRRGRYAEFNLVWDRGTRFGLETGGRVESILASLPPRARWDYLYEPDPGTREQALLDMVRAEPREWM